MARHAALVAHAGQRHQQRVVAQRLAVVALIGKQVRAAARDGVQLAQQGQRLMRQADVVIGHIRIDGQLAALHALPGNDPLALLQIDFAPWRFYQFAGAHEDQQHQAQRDARRLEHARLVARQRVQEGGQFIGVDGGVVRGALGLQDVLHVHYQVTVGQAALDGVAEYLRADGFQAMRNLGGAARLDLAQRGNQFAVPDFRDRPVADAWKNIGFQALQHVLGCTLAPCRHLVRVPLAGDFLEGIGCFLGSEPPGVVAVLAGVDSLQLQAARLRALFTRHHDRNFRIRSEGQRIFLAVRLTEFHAPDPRAAGHHFNVQAAAIEQLV